MLKNLIKLSVLFLISFNAFGKNVPVKWNGNIYRVIRGFNAEFAKFSKETCKPADEEKYYQLLRNYRGQGYYLPKLKDDIDRAAIKKNLHQYQKKIVYIGEQIKKLEKLKNFPRFNLIHVEIDQIVSHLLNLKKLYKQELLPEKRLAIRKESQRELMKLKKQFDVFMEQIFFMKSFKFPNDYLSYREEYEKYKYDEEAKDIKKANEVFFFRRIVEDGAMDPNLSRSDKFLRTSLDTLYINIHKEEDFLSEVVRYDLDWIERSLNRLVSRGKAVHLKRLREWQARSRRAYNFYKEILKTTNKKKAKFLVKKENENSQKLKDFVYGKQAEVYEWWSKKSELHKFMYVMDTILVNEVGVLDGKFGLERASVANVAMNRYFDDFYNQLNEDQMLYGLINEDVDKDDELWLNVLFKIGEFSFTYHYIPGVAKIFCPDMSRRGKSIRNENLKIALKAQKRYDTEKFKAFRYFSRISMMGKIDMSSVWTGYSRLPEMVGYESLGQKRLRRYYLADKYKYLYTFMDRNNVEYTVVRIKKKTYSMRWERGKPKFYDYRNPHLFTYFSKDQD